MSKFQKYLLGMFFILLSVNSLGLWAVEYFGVRRLSKLEKITTNLESDVAIAIRNSSGMKGENKEEISIDDLVKSNVLTRTQEETKEKPIKLDVSETESQEDIDEIKTEQGVIISLLDQLQDKLKDISSRLKIVESKQAASTTKSTTRISTPIVTQTVIPAVPVIKEQTVYLGSGSSSSTSWTDISSAVIELNSANYSNLSRVIFEANISIIGGEAFARLKNKTTGQIIEISTVSHNNSSSAQKLSGSFGLTAGSNEYIVQLRSSSNEKVVLDSARLRLFY